MTSRSHTTSRRIFLGGALLAGACATHVTGAAAASRAPGTSAAGGHRAAGGPQNYRLRPQTGAATHAPRASAAVTYTVDAPEGGEVALTFDDGPDPAHTPEVLEVLRRHRVHATFFVLGENAEANPGLLQAIADGGHRIGNHSWSHPLLTRLSNEEAREEFVRTSELITGAVGAPPALSRAPYGAWNEETLAISAELGMSPLGWSVDTCDWKQPGVPQIVSTVLENVTPGAVVLSHDGGADCSQSVTALRHYLPRLLDSGWSPVLPPVPHSAAVRARMSPALT